MSKKKARANEFARARNKEDQAWARATCSVSANSACDMSLLTKPGAHLKNLRSLFVSNPFAVNKRMGSDSRPMSRWSFNAVRSKASSLVSFATTRFLEILKLRRGRNCKASSRTLLSKQTNNSPSLFRLSQSSAGKVPISPCASCAQYPSAIRHPPRSGSANNSFDDFIRFVFPMFCPAATEQTTDIQNGCQPQEKPPLGGFSFRI